MEEIKKPRNKALIIILVIVAAILILFFTCGVGAFLIYKIFYLEPVPNPDVDYSNSSEISDTPVNNEDLIIYESSFEIYDFTFIYPESMGEAYSGNSYSACEDSYDAEIVHFTEADVKLAYHLCALFDEEYYNIEEKSEIIAKNGKKFILYVYTDDEDPVYNAHVDAINLEDNVSVYTVGWLSMSEALEHKSEIITIVESLDY